MRALKVLNTIAIGIPITLGLLGLISDTFFFYAMISTMATGFIQIMTGIYFWAEYPKNNFIKIYFAIVLLFFALLYFGIGSNWIWYLPPALCLYLSFLVYTLKN